MKKTFKLFALMLLTAFAFSSCVDVPAPFNVPDKSSSSGEGGSASDEGTVVTCAQAAELANALADGATSSEVYTITGYITEVVGDVSRNQQTFWMADTKNGGKVFEAYWANLPDGVTAFTAGTKVKITGKLMKYVNSNTGNVTPEMKNATVVVLPDDGGDTTDGDVIDVSCVLAAQMAVRLPDNTSSEETYCVTGYITKVIGAVSTKTGTPQQSFWMADKMEDGEVFQAFYANLPEDVSEFTVGMKIKMTGKLYNYVNSSGGAAEMKNGTVVILENGGGDNPTPGPQGDIQHITIAEFLAKADPNTTYELTGTVANIVNTTYGNFDLVEDGASIYIYGLLDLNGDKQKFASLGIAEGDIVTLTGKYTTFNDKPEIANAQLISFQKGDGGGDDPTPGPSGDPVTDLVNGDFEEWVSASEAAGWKSASTASNAVVSQNQNAQSGTYSCLIAANAQTNMRLATQEITLAAGTYVFSYYAKPATASDAQTRVGYVPIKDDGSVGAYKYNSTYFNINNNGWTLIENEFTLTEETTLCLIIMNPRSNTSAQYEAQDILVDNATLVKK